MYDFEMWSMLLYNLIYILIYDARVTLKNRKN